MKRLTLYEREQIALLTTQGVSRREIAKRIGRDHTVVSRELKRNTPQLFPYEAVNAHYYAERRSKKTNVRKLKKHEKLRAWVRTKLRKKWSPEQIAGRLKEHPPKGLENCSVSYEAIYQWIYDASPNGEPWLYHQLRRKHVLRRRKLGRKKRDKVQIKELVSIKERPELVGLGHLEADSIVGRNHKSGLSVHFEKTSLWVKIHHLNSLKADETHDALKATIEDLPSGFVKTITFDRGTETALHYTLRKPYQLMTFHCDPYSPYQKGGIENVNGLIRQFYPKRTDFATVTTESIAEVEDLLNNRPRKKLNYKTPNEVMGGALNS